jgi:hypothetical protein
MRMHLKQQQLSIAMPLADYSGSKYVIKIHAAINELIISAVKI